MEIVAVVDTPHHTGQTNILLNFPLGREGFSRKGAGGAWLRAVSARVGGVASELPPKLPNRLQLERRPT